MAKLRILGAVALAVLMTAPDALAQRRGGGGAVRGGMRGAMVGGMVGGKSGAAKGAKVGVVAGATRGVAERTADPQAMDSETQSRTEYESTAEYQNAQHSDFNEAPPEVLVTSATDTSPAPSAATATQQNGNRQVRGHHSQGWQADRGDHLSVRLEAESGRPLCLRHQCQTECLVRDRHAGGCKRQAGWNHKKSSKELEKYLQNIEYDDPAKTERGALLITGTGKAKRRRGRRGVRGRSL